MGRAEGLLWIAAIIVVCCTPSAHSQIVFTSPPTDIVIAEGMAARFDCAFTSTVPVSISWFKNGNILAPSSKYTFLLNNSLVINPTDTGDDVTYSCEVTNQITSQAQQRSATLDFALFLESFSTNPSTQRVEEGTLVILFCVHAGSLPPAIITWQHNNLPVILSSRILVQSSTLGHTNPPQVSSSLAITSVEREDEGTYTCTATNTFLQGAVFVSQAGILDVRAAPSPPSILENPENSIIASVGQTVTFTCSATGEPSPTISWTFNNVTLPPVMFETNDGVSVLTITDIQTTDIGIYRCTASNSQGSATSGSASLQLASISVDFELQPSDTVATLGSSVILDCRPPLSTPPANIRWSKSFAQISDTRYQILPNGSLSITNIVLEDQGVYHCTATNPLLGVSRTSEPTQLTTIGVPVITPNIVTVETGESATFSCSAEGDPAPIITWYRGTNQINATMMPRVTITGMSLTISSITLSDEDYYICRAVFAASETESQAFLNIISAPIFREFAITLTAATQSQVTLPCDFLPDPTITFFWRLNGQTIDGLDTQSYNILENGSLVIINVVDSDEGSYTCVAMNQLGTAQGTVVLDVQTVPTITAEFSELNATLGSTVTVSCSSSGDPLPVRTWLRNNSQLTTSGRFQISSDGQTLTVLNIEEADEGLYTCQASNEAGSDSDSVSLNVQAAPLVVASPPSQELLVGSIATFSCLVTGDPTPTVRWLNAQSVDVLTANDPRIQVLADESLVIANIQSEDDQQYVCEARNSVGSSVGAVSLTVLVSPSVSLPVATTSIQGNSLTLDCNAVGQPPPTTVWFRDEIALGVGGRIQTDDEGRLIFMSILSSDAGSYSCQATNEIGMATASTLLTVLVAPIIQPTSEVVAVNEGESVVLDCISSGTPQPLVTWFHDSVPLPNPDLPHIQQASNDSLVISAVVRGDEGVYICRASNQAGTESGTVALRVYVAPSVSAIDSSITAIQGSRVTLSCVATGDPSPSQTWTQNGIQVPGIGTFGQFQLESNGSVLVVRSVNETDEGDFQCHASNIAGMTFDTVSINVIVPPSFQQPLTNSSAVENTPHSLTCLAGGDPPPLITWSTLTTVLVTQGTLLFTPITRSDTGFYTCTASNSAGSISQDVYLDVQYEPAILQLTESVSVPLNDNIQLSCVVDGNPTPDISWLFNGNVIMEAVEQILSISPVTAASGGQYTCLASNNIRTASASLTLTVLFPPSAPAILRAVATSSLSITVEWAESTNDGGSPITGYVVEYREGSATFLSVSLDEDSRGMTLTDLSPFTTYDVRVRTMNIVGLSDPSGTLSTQTHPDSPSIPANFRIESSTSSSLSLAWDTPDPLNGNLAAYELHYGEDATFETNKRERLLFRNQFTVSGLLVGVVYRVQVRGGTVSLTGEILWGQFSILRIQDGVILEVVTEPPTAPPTTPPEPSTAPPTSPPITTVPTTQPPTTPQPQPSQTTPSITVSTEASSSIDEVVTTDVPSQTSSSLITSSITSPVSTPTPSQPPPITTATPLPTTLPLTPPTVVPSLVMALVPPGTQRQILVYWREPTSGLDTFIGYSITLSPAPPPSVVHPILVPRTPISGTHIVGELDHFTTYIVTVATYNEDGVGPISASDSVTTPESVPTAPRQVRGDILTQQLVIVSWLRPDPTNGIIIDYNVRVLIEPSGQLFDSTVVPTEPVNFVGLDLNNVRYRIAVSARTSVGSGPDSEPVYVGIELGVVTTTVTAQETSSESDVITATSEVQVFPSPTSTPSTPPPSTTLTSSTPTQPALSTPTTQPTTLTTLPSVVMDDTYYIVRIVPPVVFGLFLVIILMVTIFFCLHVQRTAIKKRKGAYRFSGLENEGGHEMQQKLTLDGEAVVASDDVTTSAYYVKDALDANFTYSPPSQEQDDSSSEEDEDDDVDEPDIGIALGKEGDHLSTPASPIGRDAMQESPSRPESEEVQPSDATGSMQRPVFQPGGYSYAELDSIQAKKSQDRAKRFDVNMATPTQDTPPRVVTFDPNLGLSSGGLMETRIGAVGARRSDSQPAGLSQPETSAQMY